MNCISPSFSHCVDTTPVLPGLTLGRYKLSTNDYAFTMLKTPTKGAANSEPYLANVIISSVGYQQPASGLLVSMQYIRLTNIAQTAYDDELIPMIGGDGLITTRIG